MTYLLSRVLTTWIFILVLDLITASGQCVVGLSATLNNGNITVSWDSLTSNCSNPKWVRFCSGTITSCSMHGQDKKIRNGNKKITKEYDPLLKGVKILCTEPSCFGDAVLIQTEKSTSPANPSVTSSSTTTTRAVTEHPAAETKTSQAKMLTSSPKTTASIIDEQTDTNTPKTSTVLTDTTSSTKFIITTKTITVTKTPLKDDTSTLLQNGTGKPGEYDGDKGNTTDTYTYIGLASGIVLVVLILVCVFLKMRKKRTPVDRSIEAVAVPDNEYAVVYRPNKSKDSDAGDKHASSTQSKQQETNDAAVPEIPSKNYGQELTYIEVHFEAANNDQGRKSVIHGVDNKCNYSEVCFTPNQK